MGNENADNQDQQNNADNQDQQNQDNQDNQNNQDQNQGDFSWKSKLSEDVQGSPSLKKFTDDPAGLENTVKGYLDLQKMLGYEKVPIPKDENDHDAKRLFNKALGIPDDPKGYQLSEVQIPDELKGMSQDKEGFANIAFKHGLTPKQADGLWKDYNSNNALAYENAMKSYQEKVSDTKNSLTKEWGDGYNVKINQGQSVINEFAGDKETAEFLTAALITDPRGAKFLSEIGKQFAENQIGEFSKINYTRTPAEAKREAERIMADKNHDYHSDDDYKRQKAIDYVNSLLANSAEAGKS